MTLTSDQLDQYERNGFIVYGPILTPEELAELRDTIDRLAAGEGEAGVVRRLEPEAERGGLREAREQDRTWQLLRLAPHVPAIDRHLRNPRILDIVQDLLGTEDIKYFADQAFMKAPFHGSAISWHQDSAYWTRIEPPALVSCWTALDDVTLENGAMEMVPGTHRRGVVPHVRDRLLHALGVDRSRTVPVTIPAGACSFHHSCVVHGSGPNRTAHPRRALITCYMRADSRYLGEGERPEYSLLRGREHPGCV